MGNVPLCLSKRGGIEFGEFTDITKGRFSLKSYHPYYMSFDDLSREGGSKEDGMSGRDSTTILGLEMDQESVCRWYGWQCKAHMHAQDGRSKLSNNWEGLEEELMIKSQLFSRYSVQ